MASRGWNERPLWQWGRRLLPAPVRRNLGALLRRLMGVRSDSQEYERAAPGSLQAGEGWRAKDMAHRQQVAFGPVLLQLREGHPRQDFLALADAVGAAGCVDPLIVEVGCGGAWNFEVMSRLWAKPFRYIGLDFSPTMVSSARESYRANDYVCGDATCLPLKDASCDMLLAGAVLMHVPEYRAAIAEAARVARTWCIFHSMPVTAKLGTTLLRKRAYGELVPEVVFNEPALLESFRDQGLRVERVFESLPYDLRHVVGEKTKNRTYLCRVGP